MASNGARHPDSELERQGLRPATASSVDVSLGQRGMEHGVGGGSPTPAASNKSAQKLFGSDLLAIGIEAARSSAAPVSAVTLLLSAVAPQIGAAYGITSQYVVGHSYAFITEAASDASGAVVMQAMGRIVGDALEEAASMAAQDSHGYRSWCTVVTAALRLAVTSCDVLLILRVVRHICAFCDSEVRSRGDARALPDSTRQALSLILLELRRKGEWCACAGARVIPTRPHAVVCLCVCVCGCVCAAWRTDGERNSTLQSPPTARGWKCELCNEDNRPTDLACTMCSSPAPAGVGDSSGGSARHSRRIPMLPRWTCGLCGTENPLAAPECCMCATPSKMPAIAASCRDSTQSLLHVAADVLASLDAAAKRLDGALVASLATALPHEDGADALPTVSPLTVHAGAGFLEEMKLAMDHMSGLFMLGAFVCVRAPLLGVVPHRCHAPWRRRQVLRARSMVEIEPRTRRSSCWVAWWMPHATYCGSISSACLLVVPSCRGLCVGLTTSCDVPLPCCSFMPPDFGATELQCTVAEADTRAQRHAARIRATLDDIRNVVGTSPSARGVRTDGWAAVTNQLMLLQGVDEAAAMLANAATPSATVAAVAAHIQGVCNKVVRAMAGWRDAESHVVRY